jgi:hypothetical protein
MSKKIKQGKLIRQEQEETIAKLGNRIQNLEQKLLDLTSSHYYDLAIWYKVWLVSLEEEIEHEIATAPSLRGEGIQVDGKTIWTLPKGYTGGMTGWRRDALALTCDRLKQHKVLKFWRCNTKGMIEAVKDDYFDWLPSKSELMWTQASPE